jgi:hypothetical protein
VAAEYSLKSFALFNEPMRKRAFQFSYQEMQILRFGIDTPVLRQSTNSRPAND